MAEKQTGTSAEELARAAAAAQALLEQTKGNAPGAYDSSYGAQIDALVNQIASRPGFSYDMNGDPLYQQYQQQYQRQGKAAMADTLGAAAGLTGGYGNSYGTTVASQAYQDYLSKVGDVVPALYEAAYNRYQTEGDALTQQLSSLQNRENSAYSAYRDKVNDYQNQLSSAANYWQYLSDAAYKAQQDELAQSNWQKQFDIKYGGGGSRGGGSSRNGKATAKASTALPSITKGGSVTLTGKPTVLTGAGQTLSNKISRMTK